MNFGKWLGIMILGCACSCVPDPICPPCKHIDDAVILNRQYQGEGGDAPLSFPIYRADSATIHACVDTAAREITISYALNDTIVKEVWEFWEIK